MSGVKVDTLVVGGGQAGLAMSEHLREHGIEHLVLERARIAESWRVRRWDSLVANGPAWHDRFPNMTFADFDQDGFVPKDGVADYFERYASHIGAPVQCGVEVLSVTQKADGMGFDVETSAGPYEARNIVAATGPFQKPIIPPIVPAETEVRQIHSNDYHNPAQLPPGAVLVVGAGSSGAQIADELLRSGRTVYLSVGPHDRPPRRYRGRDFCWWLGALGKWDATKVQPGREHVTIAVSGAHGGHTVDFREMAGRGMTLLGMARGFEDGVMQFADDLAINIAEGDANYLSVLAEADALVARDGLDLPEEAEAHLIGPAPECITNPTLQLDLARAEVTSIIWATGYAFDFSWLQVDAFDGGGRPLHEGGVSKVPGLYFLGLPWLTRRASAFIWGVWVDARSLALSIAERADARDTHSSVAES